MNMKITRILGFLCLLFFAVPVYASPYTPLVQIPGLGTEVTISSYLIGIYNFLLSIVGIVAVMMLILGGMRYISAAGNSAAIGEAKSMIEGAISGLLLALLSWLIVSTINPDILYVKQPGMTNPGTKTLDTYNPGDSNCLSVSSYKYCDGSTTQNCICASGNTIPCEGQTAGISCNDLCTRDGQCGGGKFLVVKLHARNAITAESISYPTSQENEVVVGNETRGWEPDQLWELLLTDDLTYGDFDLNGYQAIRGDSCAILATNEDNNGFDEVAVYWVDEGIKIGTKDNIYQSIVGRYVDCCGSTGCGVSVWNECSETEFNRVVKANFSASIIDSTVENVSYAQTDGADGWDYELKNSLTCSNGRWLAGL